MCQILEATETISAMQKVAKGFVNFLLVAVGSLRVLRALYL